MVKHMTQDERTMYIFAFRYAVTRRTYARWIVNREIAKHIEDFQDWELEDMIHDCKAPFYRDMVDECDRNEMDLFADYLQKVLQDRAAGEK